MESHRAGLSRAEPRDGGWEELGKKLEGQGEKWGEFSEGIKAYSQETRRCNSVECLPSRLDGFQPHIHYLWWYMTEIPVSRGKEFKLHSNIT